MTTTVDANAVLRRAVSLTKAARGCGLEVLDVRCVEPAPDEVRMVVDFGLVDDGKDERDETDRMLDDLVGRYTGEAATR